LNYLKVENMPYDPRKHRRRSIRLRGYDYSLAGIYFFTICVQDRECLLGRVEASEMHLSLAGQMVLATWSGLPARWPQIELDTFCIMPNHIHGIIFIQDNAPAGATLVAFPTVLGVFKSITTHQYTKGVKEQNWPSFRGRLWQRNYYERIIRDEDELNRARIYIADNPAKWDADDPDNPARHR
jgi:putative transposase